MKQQFDSDIRNAMLHNLDNIHASDELIAKTLERLRLEGHVSDVKPVSNTVLTAIDSDFVADHVKNTNKMKAGRIIIALTAAIVILISCVALKYFTDEQSIKETTPNVEAEIAPYQCCLSGGTDYYSLSREAASQKRPASGYEKIPRGNTTRHSSAATRRLIG